MDNDHPSGGLGLAILFCLTYWGMWRPREQERERESRIPIHGPVSFVRWILSFTPWVLVLIVITASFTQSAICIWRRPPSRTGEATMAFKYDEEREMPQPLAWIIIILFSASIMGFGVLVYRIVDNGPRHWDVGRLPEPRQNRSTPPRSPGPAGDRNGSFRNCPSQSRSCLRNRAASNCVNGN